MAEQVSMKPLMEVGVIGAARCVSKKDIMQWENLLELTRVAVQVGQVQDISRAALSAAGGAERDLTLLVAGGGSNGRGGEEEDSGEKHLDGLVWWLVAWLEMVDGVKD
jgi:hypothetical protein